jgi:tRNA A37 N6-isopentenylltransferase MiaA
MLLTGPTTVGKSDVAQALAVADGYEMLPADKFYFYDHPGLAIGTGLADSSSTPGIERHLYGTLDVDSPPPSPSEYLRLVRETVSAIHARGERALIEGCSRSYSRALIESELSPFQPVIGLEWKSVDGVIERIRRRVETFFELGLIEETESALAAGLSGTYVMRKSVIYRAVLDHLSGKDSLETCQDRICDEIWGIAQTQSATYHQIRGIHWIKHDPSKLEATLDKIRAVVSRPASSSQRLLSLA